MKKLLLLLIVILLAPLSVSAADSACARVKIEIPQELTLERVAFDAKLVITNNLPDKELTNIRVDVHINDGEDTDSANLFFVAAPTLDGLDDVDGSGTVSANSRAETHWLIIPSPGSGGTDPNGVYYFVGATLSYTVNGIDQTVDIFPDRINVRPMPLLYLDYFTPYRVIADNPFTPEVEPPIPFPLAVRVLNDGYGPAWKLKIESAQPKIVENLQGLLIDFKLLGASVNDSEVDPSLTVDMGDVASKSAATGYWEMITTLSGRFEEFAVSFTHDPGLGGELTSLLKETNAHYLTHRVKVNLAGRDQLLDFLADTDRDEEHLPDAIFESEIPAGGEDRTAARAEVTVVDQVTAPNAPSTQNPNSDVTLDLFANPPGWIYTRMDDPSQGLLVLEAVTRADGVRLDPNNFWVDEGLDDDFKPTHKLQFVDYRGDAGGTPATYTLSYTPPPEDNDAPVTTLIFDGPAVEGEITYLTPATRIVFTARDNEGGSGVAEMFRQLFGSDDEPIAALPFNLNEVGDYNLDYYSTDRAGNIETTKSIALKVDDTAPTIDAFTTDVTTFAPQAPRGVDTARAVAFNLTASDDVPNLGVTVEIVSPTGEVVRTLSGTATAGATFSLNWDGKDDDGSYVGAGDYTATVNVTDGLDDESGNHTTDAQTGVTVGEWFAAQALDPYPGAHQLNPAIDGNMAVWQDDRNGQWDIYYKDLDAASSVRITGDSADQQTPAISGDLIVWQDARNDAGDIYGYRLSSGTEFVIASESGEQSNPTVSGDWAAWQDQRNGSWNIYARNLTTGESIQVTNHERDQIRPVSADGVLYWEDYRYGLAEIVRYDLATGDEQRITSNIANQFLPAASGSTLVWTDQRDGQQEIYRSATSGDAVRLTYGSGDRSQAAVYGNLLVYTDYSNGSGDPNLGFLDLQGGNGGTLSNHTARQEQPAVGDGVVLWQDDRDGSAQIYRAALVLADLPVEVILKPGFNLIAVGRALVDTYGNAAALLAAENGPSLDKALQYSAPHARFFEADLATGDFALTAGAGVILYAAEESTLTVAAAGEEISYTLLPGTNHIGILNVPFGYRAYDLLRSVGLSQVVSVRKFDNETGLWRSAAVRANGDNMEIVGIDFPIAAGDGLVVTMQSRVDGWTP